MTAPENYLQTRKAAPIAVLNVTPVSAYPAKNGFGDEAPLIPEHVQVTFLAPGVKYYIQMHERQASQFEHGQEYRVAFQLKYQMMGKTAGFVPSLILQHEPRD